MLLYDGVTLLARATDDLQSLALIFGVANGELRRGPR